MSLPEGNEDLQATCDSQLDDLFVQVGKVTNGFLSQKGWYFQGISTATEIPLDGLAVDQVDTKAPVYDPASTWKQAGIVVPAKMQMSVAVDNYEGPKGKDWSLRGTLVLDNTRWRRTISGNNLEVVDEDWTNLGEIEAATVVLDPIGVLSDI